jgi:ABC-2 type transport system permease protein
MLRTLRAEVMKLKSSAIPAWTAAVVVLMPLAVYAPIRFADNGGAMPDWSKFMRAAPQLTAAYGVVLFGFVAAWMFGREYADRTPRGCSRCRCAASTSSWRRR